MKIKNIKGQKFGKLNVIEFAGQNKSRDALWLCKCECGNEKVIRGYSLRLGRTISCGCLKNSKAVEASRKKTWLGDGVAITNRLFNEYEKGANRRGLVFELTRDLFSNLIHQDCHYCRSKPTRTRTSPSGSTVTYRCNVAKNDMSYDEFKEWIIKLYKNLHK